MVPVMSLAVPILLSAVIVFVVKTMFDGLVYGLLTAGTFGWLWPR
jgi:hypothetical protein